MERRMNRHTEIDTQRPARASRRATARWIADLYCLWRLCGKSACRRARACKCDTRSCLRALPLVPPEALLFLKGFDEARVEWLSFDEMMARNEEEWAAVEEWQELVMTTLPGAKA
jgi:hypothetical protein